MSTRANIIITDARGNESILYHHHDGYPEGVGQELKCFLYYLRGLLACAWIERRLSIPPVKLEELVSFTVTSTEIKSAITQLLTLKRQSKEHDQSSVPPILIDYTRNLMGHYKQILPSFKPQLPKEGVTPHLDHLFYSMSLNFGKEKKTTF